jgi:hypothetical protein
MRHREVTDPRDKIFGVMGLATPAHVAGMVPDYSLTWAETYGKFYSLMEAQVLSNSSRALEGV